MSIIMWRKMLSLFFVYITFFVNTLVGAEDFDSNVFIFWNSMNITGQQRAKVDNFFCMGIAFYTKWILVSRVCFDNPIQSAHPESFSVVPVMNTEVFDDRYVNDSHIFEVETIFINVSRFVDSGIAILMLKNENQFALNITKFLSTTKLNENDTCKSLILEKESTKKYSLLHPRTFEASQSKSCTNNNLYTGDICATSNVTEKLCNVVRSSLLQCNNHIQGVSGYKIDNKVICARPPNQLSVVYVDFAENIFHIVIFLLSLKGTNEASGLSSSKVLILTAVIISTYRLMKKTV